MLKKILKSGEESLLSDIQKVIDELKIDPHKKRPKMDIKLISTKKESIYRIQLGKYRVVYEIDETNKTVILKYCNFAYVIYAGSSIISQILVIHMMEHTSIDKGYKSLVERTIEAQMTAELMDDYAFATAIARSLKDFFLSYFYTYLGSERSEGQLIYRVVPANVPPGIEVRKIKTLPVRITLYNQSDLEAVREGIPALQKHRIIRITNEVFDQGGVLTQADLSILLGESLRTISNRVAELKQEGIIVPTRGNKMDIGPGVSHKVKIVDMYLQGYDFTEIKRRTRHSSESISRYLNDFARVACLDERAHTPKEIRIITGHSDRLIRQYLKLKASVVNEKTQERYEQVTARFAQGKKKSPYDQRGDQIYEAILEGKHEHR